MTLNSAADRHSRRTLLQLVWEVFCLLGGIFEREKLTKRRWRQENEEDYTGYNYEIKQNPATWSKIKLCTYFVTTAAQQQAGSGHPLAEVGLQVTARLGISGTHTTQYLSICIACERDTNKVLARNNSSVLKDCPEESYVWLLETETCRDVLLRPQPPLVSIWAITAHKMILCQDTMIPQLSFEGRQSWVTTGKKQTQTYLLQGFHPVYKNMHIYCMLSTAYALHKYITKKHS